MTDSVYWIWFQLLFGVGTRRAELLMNYFASPKDIFDGIAARDRVVGMLEDGELLGSADTMADAEKLKIRTLKKGCDILTPDDPRYPRLLLSINSRPAALYVKGDLTCLRDTLSIAMVGTRHHTAYGGEAAGFLAGGLAKLGAVVVSGLAPGIDTECHRAALAAGGDTVGVLGCGLDVDYPSGSRALKRAMSDHGAVVTEFPLGVTPFPGNFPLRNRLISGMAHGTVVVEADLHSGSLITARCALEQGREIFAVPGSIFVRGEQGTHHLIKDGARLVETVEDILQEYPQFEYKLLHRSAVLVESGKASLPDDDPRNRRDVSVSAPQQPKPRGKKTSPPPEKRPLPDGAGEYAGEVYGRFAQDTMTVDDLTTATGIAAGDILSALTELEIYGLIQSYPGRRFGLL